MFELLDDLGLHTVCEGANCPNLGVCFARKRVTFLILGRQCTRHCRFCALGGSLPLPPDPGEPQRVAEAVRRLGLEHAVLTSPTRDDLPDGGASWFARTAEQIRKIGDCQVEVLVPDFQGNPQAIRIVCEAPIGIFAHNLETVRRLTPLLRDRAGYQRSLSVLARAREFGLTTKSGLMLGLGETQREVIRSLEDLRAVDCQQVAMGQYLPPGPSFAPVTYLEPRVFEELRDLALSLGFRQVQAGPLVRSSYA